MKSIAWPWPFVWPCHEMAFELHVDGHVVVGHNHLLHFDAGGREQPRAEGPRGEGWPCGLCGRPGGSEGSVKPGKIAAFMETSSPLFQN